MRLTGSLLWVLQMSLCVPVLWLNLESKEPVGGVRKHESMQRFQGCMCWGHQEKIETIARETYGAASVEYLPQAEKQIELYTRMGFSGLPICMAKTQYSFSADAAVKVNTHFAL